MEKDRFATNVINPTHSPDWVERHRIMAQAIISSLIEISLIIEKHCQLISSLRQGISLSFQFSISGWQSTIDDRWAIITIFKWPDNRLTVFVPSENMFSVLADSDRRNWLFMFDQNLCERLVFTLWTSVHLLESVCPMIIPIVYNWSLRRQWLDTGNQLERPCKLFCLRYDRSTARHARHPTTRFSN